MTAYMSWSKAKPGGRDAQLGYRRSSFSQARANHPRIATEFLASALPSLFGPSGSKLPERRADC
jgi:hypothetical protein